MVEDSKRVPKSRAARTAVLGRVAASQAARHAGAKVRTVGASDERRARVMDKRQAEAMKALVDALGLMRGGAMKIGQMLSMLDIGMIPAELREDFQKSMARLQDSAPTVSFKQMSKVIEDDLGQRLKDVFAEFDENPIGAASIGQVYRARLHDGREVAVKVQYPGIDRAVRADLKNLGLIMRALKRIVPEQDMGALADEIRERIGEELDYELEAQNQRMAARLYSGHPFIFVPAVLTDLCGQHVLVTEYFKGRRFDELVDADQATRDRVGEIVYRFYGGSLYQHRQFSPDPHPGNFLVGDDGRIAFLDFGLYRHMDVKTIEQQSAILRGVFDQDAAGLHRVLCEYGFIPDPDRVEPERALAYLTEMFWWMGSREPVEMLPEYATEAMAQLANPTSEYFELARHQQLPAEFLFVVRMIAMVMAAVGQLRATAPWHSIAREWIDQAEPETELGRLDAAYRQTVLLAG